MSFFKIMGATAALGAISTIVILAAVSTAEQGRCSKMTQESLGATDNENRNTAERAKGHIDE